MIKNKTPRESDIPRGHIFYIRSAKQDTFIMNHALVRVFVFKGGSVACDVKKRLAALCQTVACLAGGTFVYGAGHLACYGRCEGVGVLFDKLCSKLIAALLYNCFAVLYAHGSCA